MYYTVASLGSYEVVHWQRCFQFAWRRFILTATSWTNKYTGGPKWEHRRAGHTSQRRSHRCWADKAKLTQGSIDTRHKVNGHTWTHTPLLDTKGIHTQTLMN